MIALRLLAPSALVLGLASCTATTSTVAEPVSRPDRVAHPTVRVEGAVPQPATFDVASLTATSKVESVPWMHDDVTMTSRGVSLYEVLAACGHSSGPGGRDFAPHERRPGWGKVVVAWGADGHQAVFSCAELDPALGPATKSYVVWDVDGAPLPSADGPFRLVTPTDERGFRSVRRLVRLVVRDLREVPTASAPGS